MGDTLHKMQVIIEATTEPLKKGMENSRREVKKSVEEIQKETEKIKNPFKGMESKALQPVRNTLNKIREMLSKNLVKNFQIKAGIKVPTEEYQQLQEKTMKAQKLLDGLQEKKQKFEGSGKSKENQQWQSLAYDIEHAKKKLTEYKTAAAGMRKSGTAFEEKPTDEYLNIQNSIKAVNEQIRKYEAKGDKLEAAGVKKESKQWQNLKYDIDQAYTQLWEYEDKAKELEKSGKATKKAPTEEYKNLQKDILQVRQELERYQEKEEKLQTLGVSKESQEWKKLKNDIASAQRKVNEYQTEAAKMQKNNTDVKRPVSLPRQALNFGTGIFKGIGTTVSKGWGGFTKLLGGIGNIASSFSGVIRKCSGAYAALIQKFTSGIPFLNRTKSSFNGLGTSGRGLTGILKTIGMTAKFMFASFVIRGAVDGAKQGFQNLAQYSGETNRSLSLLMSSLTQLKNSLATAFAPILNVVAPILNSFIQTVINVVNSIGQLMGALTGKTTMVTAKKVNQDYAASLNSTSTGLKNNAKNADTASKAAKQYQRTLLGFDQINKLNDDSDSSGSGGEGSGTDTSPLGGVNDMFQGGYVISGLFNGMKAGLPAVLSWIAKLPGQTKERLGNAKTWLRGKGNAAITGLKNGWEAVRESTFLSRVKKIGSQSFNAIGDIKSKVTPKGRDIISGMRTGLNNNWSSLSGILSNIPGKVANAIPSLYTVGQNVIQTFANGFSSIHIPMPHIGWDWEGGSIKIGNFKFSLPRFNLSWYANGGFPGMGEMFVARESGPELVGRMGNHSAVANNNQIIAGIRAGVFEAVVNAFESMQGRNDRGRELHIYLEGDAKKLFKVIRQEGNNYQKQTGNPVFG